MKIALYDVDNTKYPNYALMKISSYHKKIGNDVVFYDPLWHNTYDKIYASSVFSYSNKTYVTDDMIRGGSGFDLKTILLKVIDIEKPDLSLYNLDYAIGYLTRGCIRNCNFCIVPEKEGKLSKYLNIEDILQGKKKVILMDNNVLASDHGLEQIEKIIKLGVKVDFNQGLDARIIADNKEIAQLLSQVKWLKPLRMACDSEDALEPVIKATELLRSYNCTPRNYFIYHVIQDINKSNKILDELLLNGLDPFAQPFINKQGIVVNKEAKRMARWCNHKAIFKTVTWDDYKK